MRDLIEEKGNTELSAEERNYFSVAYKNVVGSKRTAWRVLSSLLKTVSKEEEEILREYIADITKEIESTCTEVVVS